MSSNIAPENPRNGSSVDPASPTNEPGLDQARKDIREGHEKRIDRVRRDNATPDPLKKVSNK